MVDLNDVALFVQVVHAGSFAEAARRLGMPSNTLSRRIQQLEAALGARLLHRSTRKLTLTEAGAAFHARCADSVETLSDAATDMADGGLPPGGKIRVAAAADFFNWFPMEWVAEFLDAHPKVRLEFALSDGRADLVAERIDLAIRAGQVLEPTVVARRIGAGQQTLVASPAYLRAHGTPRSPEDLPAHDCIVMSSASGRPSWRLDGPDGVIDMPVSGRLQANSAQALLQAAMAGLGIALLPDIMSAPHLRSGALVPVLPQFGVKGVDVHLVYQSRRQLPRAVQAFVEFTIAKMRDSGLVQPT
ncbi:LysR family transcriptional regulator [Achromobacter sp. Marseille-Q0513]|uniref:LysR family transcriptional regulator n=1 Tax=Achromobacter sp. Marseille-Q0513 TaxID=2829161 RepID=UPI001B9E1BBE|nr:LysR family transcriptional regulator [Achromobacter sp. Marseille-Q0513]MBR8653943.1 LysR family transcriptional regulator [Achromobacter sp. Marseille-Q0513]